MIRYTYGFCSPWCAGSVIPKSVLYALPSGILGYVMKVLQINNTWGYGWGQHTFKISGPAYAGFVSVLGFLVVFRTSGAYQRFVHGSQSVNEMSTAFFDAASAMICFTKGSKANPKAVEDFRQVIVRLMSLLSALCYVKMAGLEETSQLRLSRLHVIDLGGLDATTLAALKEDNEHMVDMLYCWIKSLVAEAVNNHILVVQPPMASEMLVKLDDGLSKFEHCRIIAQIPFPFPYAQSTLWLLIVNMVVTPLVMCNWAHRAAAVAMFTFVQIFMFWCMILISWQLENPFGEDANDLPLTQHQKTFNARLKLLLKPSLSSHRPFYSKQRDAAVDITCLQDFFDVVVDDDEEGYSSLDATAYEEDDDGDLGSSVTTVTSSSRELSRGCTPLVQLL